MGGTQEAARAVLRIVEFHGDVQHHGVGCRHTARGPRLEQCAGRRVGLCRPDRQFLSQRVDRLAAQPRLNRRRMARRASTVVEDHVRRLDVAIEGLCRIQETARAILRIEKIDGDVEHHGIGGRHSARRPGFQ